MLDRALLLASRGSPLMSECWHVVETYSQDAGSCADRRPTARASTGQRRRGLNIPWRPTRWLGSAGRRLRLPKVVEVS